MTGHEPNRVQRRVLALSVQAEADARSMLQSHFGPIYRDRITSYIEMLMATDHYAGRYEYLQSVIGHALYCADSKVLVSGCGVGSEMIVAREYGLGDV